MRFARAAALVLFVVPFLSDGPAGTLAAPETAGPREGAGPAPGWDDRERFRTDLLVVLAHPDDEGVVAPLIAREALERHRRVAVVYLTDGRNGTNRAGTLAGAALAEVRLAEVSWTLERLGVFFHRSLGQPDGIGGGEPSAILEAWERAGAVVRLVRLVRLLRPAEMITWVPGPASSNGDHAAAGGAALVAAMQAGQADESPEQIGEEHLEPYAIPSILLVAQAEKLAYPVYPGTDAIAGTKAGARIERLDVFSETLGRTFTDQAREALKEQRATAAANNLARGGPFDDPLVLWPLRAEAPERIRIGGDLSADESFLRGITARVGSPDAAALFQPEVVGITAAGRELHLTLSGTKQLPEKLTVELPRRWKAKPSSFDVRSGPGGSAAVSFEVRPPKDAAPGHYAAALVAEEGIRVPFVLTVPPARSGSGRRRPVAPQEP